MKHMQTETIHDDLVCHKVRCYVVVIVETRPSVLWRIANVVCIRLCSKTPTTIADLCDNGLHSSLFERRVLVTRNKFAFFLRYYCEITHNRMGWHIWNLSEIR